MLQECKETDMLEGVVHAKLEFDTPHDQLFSNLTNLDTGQTTSNEKVMVAELDMATAQPIKLEKIHRETYKKAKIYKERNKKFHGNHILCRGLHPAKLWVLNTRLKPVRGRRMSC
ncbi:hypothetical protein DVH24_035970 [Malus domestica]|uniref:Uncharacterized protein n=1 Tax=Malus domestica TaxID=3750 RepID=A0A498JUU3_MALDO|nr:hypothetical protein DVH24_035970 [Malus domestica]